MTGFTKGPWVVGEFGDVFVRKEEIPNLIASVIIDTDEFYNAHLISAAPELYEALEDLVNWFQSEYGESDRLKSGLSALDKARGNKP